MNGDDLSVGAPDERKGRKNICFLAPRLVGHQSHARSMCSFSVLENKVEQKKGGSRMGLELQCIQKKSKGETINPNDARGGIQRQKRGKRAILDNS